MTTTYTPGQIALFQGDPALILQVEAMSIQLSVIPGITSLIGDFHSELEEYDETPSPAFARRIEELRAYYADRFPVPATTAPDDEYVALEGVGPNGDVAGYTYRADMMAPSRLIEQLIGEGRLAPGARGMDPEEALDQLAAIEGIDRLEETSFDSDTFPKVVLTYQVQAEDVPYLSA